MNKEVKVLLVTLAVSLGLIWVFKPRKSSNEKNDSSNKYAEPKVASEDVKKEKESAVVGLQAMREAINAGESKSELEKLKSLILKEHGVKVLISTKSGLLRAMNKKGNVVAEEEFDNKK